MEMVKIDLRVWRIDQHDTERHYNSPPPPTLSPNQKVFCMLIMIVFSKILTGTVLYMFL